MTDINVKKLDLKTASKEDFAAINTFGNIMRAEAEPDDPPRSLDYTVNSLTNLPSFVTLHFWNVWQDKNIIASGNLAIFDREDNQHLAQGSISVHPEWRQQGLAKQLLPLILEVAQKENKRLIIDGTNDNIPAGAALMKRLDAKAGIATHTNQLLVSELDHELMQQWQDRTKERASDYELLRWQGDIPEEYLQAYFHMSEVMNTQPLDDLEVEDFKVTPKEIRQREAHMNAVGIIRWTLISRHKPTGDFAGYTELLWNPEDPQTLNQDSTAVDPKHRGKGLGRWLKAAMLEHVLSIKPDVKRVRTGNADSNDAMLKINNEMGFKPYKAVTVWQVEVENIAKYLNQ